MDNLDNNLNNLDNSLLVSCLFCIFAPYFSLFLRLPRFLSLGGCLYKCFAKCRQDAVFWLIRETKKERFLAAPSYSMPHACIYNGAPFVHS